MSYGNPFNHNPTTPEATKYWKSNPQELVEEAQRIARKMSYKLLTIGKFDECRDIRNYFTKKIAYIDDVYQYKTGNELHINDDTFYVEPKPVKELPESKQLTHLESLAHYIDEEGTIYPEDTEGNPDLKAAYDMDSRLRNAYIKGEDVGDISEKDRQTIRRIFN